MIGTRNQPWVSKPPLGTPVNRAASWSPNVAGLWVINEGAGDKLTDLSGNNNTGTLTTHTWVPGLNGGPAFNLAGTSAGNLDVGTSATLNPPAMSICVWVKLASLAHTYSSVVVRSSGAGTLYRILVKSTGKLAMGCLNTASTFNSYDVSPAGTITLATGIWYHVAMVIDAASGITGYVNGVLDQNTGMSSLNIATSTNATQFGEDPNNTSRRLQGAIESAVIFNRALSAFEVQQLYAQPYSLVQPRRGFFSTAAAASGGPFPFFTRRSMHGGMITQSGGLT